jgi:putative transposase
MIKWVPHMPVLHVGSSAMPSQLKRFYGHNDLHFVTFSCYERRPLLDTAAARNAILQVLAVMRERRKFLLVGYVVMPDHVHLLISEPEKNDLSVVVKALKCRVSTEMIDIRRLESSRDGNRGEALPHFWLPRFHDFNVYTSEKKKEKLQYMHENPVTRGLVRFPGEWMWSSFLFYATGQAGIVPVDVVG